MFSSRFLPFLLLVNACITSLLVYFSGNLNGPGTTFDSFHYLYAGLSLAQKGTLTLPSNQPFIEWPPLYPTLISGINIMPGNILKGVFYFQVLIAGLTTWFSGVLAIKFIQSKIILLVTFLAIAFSTPIILINHFIWSESLFTILFMLHLVNIYNYIYRNHKSNWWLLIITGSLLCLQRHVGVFIISGTAIVLLQFPITVLFRIRVRHSLIYSLATVFSLTVWWLRNFMVRGQIMNDYSSNLFTVSVMTHWRNYQHVFTSWFLPNEIPVWIRSVLVFTCISFLIYKYCYQRKASDYQHQVLFSFAIIFLTYYLLTYAASYAVNEYLDDRILAPIYLPGIIIFFYLLNQFYDSLNSKVFKQLILLACLGWAIYPVSRSIVNVWIWHNQEVRATPERIKDKGFENVFKFN